VKKGGKRGIGEQGGASLCTKVISLEKKRREGKRKQMKLEQRRLPRPARRPRGKKGKKGKRKRKKDQIPRPSARDNAPRGGKEKKVGKERVPATFETSSSARIWFFDPGRKEKRKKKGKKEGREKDNEHYLLRIKRERKGRRENERFRNRLQT